jgi:hypothetical protein
MKLELRTTRVTTDKDGRTVQQNPGDVIDLPSDEAKALLESDQAAPVARKKAERAERR